MNVLIFFSFHLTMQFSAYVDILKLFLIYGVSVYDI